MGALVLGAAVAASGPNGLFLQVGFNPSHDRALYDAAKAQLQGEPSVTLEDLSGAGDAGFVESSGYGGACHVLKSALLGHITVVSRTELRSPAAALDTVCRAMAGRL